MVSLLSSFGMWRALKVLDFEFISGYFFELLLIFSSRADKYESVKIHNVIIELAGVVEDAEGS